VSEPCLQLFPCAIALKHAFLFIDREANPVKKSLRFRLRRRMSNIYPSTPSGCVCC